HLLLACPAGPRCVGAGVHRFLLLLRLLGPVLVHYSYLVHEVVLFVLAVFRHLPGHSVHRGLQCHALQPFAARLAFAQLEVVPLMVPQLEAPLMLEASLVLAPLVRYPAAAMSIQVRLLLGGTSGPQPQWFGTAVERLVPV